MNPISSAVSSSIYEGTRKRKRECLAELFHNLPSLALFCLVEQLDLPELISLRMACLGDRRSRVCQQIVDYTEHYLIWSEIGKEIGLVNHKKVQRSIRDLIQIVRDEKMHAFAKTRRWETLTIEDAKVLRECARVRGVLKFWEGLSWRVGVHDGNDLKQPLKKLQIKAEGFDAWISAHQEPLQALTSFRFFGEKSLFLPEACGKLTFLKSLKISCNLLELLPECLIQLTALEEVDLSLNRFAVFPEVLTQLTSLKKIDLGYNQLTRLPETIGRLTSLEELNLHLNKLTSLPQALSQLKDLRKLDLTYNLDLVDHRQVVESLKLAGCEILQ